MDIFFIKRLSFLFIFIATFISFDLIAKVDVKACTSNSECASNEWCDLATGVCVSYAQAESTPSPVATLSPVPSPSPLPILNVCTQGVDLFVQAGDAPPKNAIDLGAEVRTIEGCPFRSSPFIPPNTVRVTEVFDASSLCDACPPSVRDLIIKYFKGDLASGDQLCNIPIEQLQNCIILNSSYVILDKQEAITYLTPEERDSLSKKWPFWQAKDKAPGGNSRSLSTIVYASAKQVEESNFIAPQDIEVTLLEDKSQEKWKVTQKIAKDIMKLKIDPSQAIEDIEAGNIYPDFNDEDGRKISGSLNYTYYIKDAKGIEIPRSKHKPFYHGNFHSIFSLGYFAKIWKLVSSKDDKGFYLERGFKTLLENWNTIRKRYGLLDSIPQQPLKSPWDPVNDIKDRGADDAEKLGLVIYAKSKKDTSEFDFTFQNDIVLFNYVIGNIYGFKDYTYFEVPKTQATLDDAFQAIKKVASEAKEKKKKVQLFIYITGHGGLGEVEPPLKLSGDEAKAKEGGFIHVLNSSDGSSTFDEHYLKTKLIDLVEKDKVIDDFVLINDTCHSGASII